MPVSIDTSILFSAEKKAGFEQDFDASALDALDALDASFES